MVFTFLARSLTSYEVVIDLAERGYPAEAMTVMRSICELDIDLAFIMKGDVDNNLKLYWEHEAIITHRQVQDWMEAGRHIDAATRKAVKQEASRVGPNYKQGKHDSWCGRSIEHRARDTGRLAMYRFAYSYGCHAAHSGPKSLRFVAKFQPHESAYLGTITIGAGEPDAVPMNCATAPMLQILSTADRYCDLGLDAPIAELFDEMNAMGHEAAAHEETMRSGEDGDGPD